MLKCPRCGYPDESALAKPEQGMICAGWRYRHKKDGDVTLSFQPPDRVSNLEDYEATELFAHNPMLAAAPPAGEGKG